MFQQNGNPFVNKQKATNEEKKLSKKIYEYYMLRIQKILNTSHVALECFGVLLLVEILSIYHFIFFSTHSHSLSPSLSLPWLLFLLFCCSFHVGNFISNKRRSTKFLRFHIVYRQIVLSSSWLWLLHIGTKLKKEEKTGLHIISENWTTSMTARLIYLQFTNTTYIPTCGQLNIALGATAITTPIKSKLN